MSLGTSCTCTARESCVCEHVGVSVCGGMCVCTCVWVWVCVCVDVCSHTHESAPPTLGEVLLRGRAPVSSLHCCQWSNMGHGREC